MNWLQTLVAIAWGIVALIAAGMAIDLTGINKGWWSSPKQRELQKKDDDASS